MRRRPSFLLLVGLAVLLAGVCPGATAQVPVRPPVCNRLMAAPLNPNFPESGTAGSDTRRIQAALDLCGAGQAVELASNETDMAFHAGPLRIPAGVTLWIDPGVLVAVPSCAAWLQVKPGSQTAGPASLAGFGTVEVVGADASCPLGLDFAAPFQVSGVVLRAPGGVRLRAAAGGGLQDVKILGGPLKLEGGAQVSIAGSLLAAPGAVLETDAPSRVALTGVAVYRGIIPEQPAGAVSTAPCIANSGQEPACQPAALPPVSAELVLSAEAEACSLVVQPDARLPFPAGEVDLLDGQEVVQRGTLQGSAAVFPLGSLSAGLHHLTARYAEGDLRFGDLWVDLSHARPQQAAPALTLTATATTFPYGTPLTLTASLPGGTGAVSFLDGGAVLGQAVMLSGTASLTTSALALGPHTVSAAYAGDGTNPAQTSPALNLQVNPVTTQAALAALPQTVPYGTAVTLAGSVLPVTATGMLTFHDGAAVLGTATLAHGSASLQAGSLSTGQHTVSVSYGGDTFDLPATSPAQVLTVEPLSTTTALAATPAHPTVGTPVTLSVAVLPPDSSGTVSVFDGVTPLGRIPLAAGMGTLPVPSLAPGVHTMTALYSGDAAHLGSTSSVTLVTVDPLSTTTTIAALPATIPAGTALALSAHVSPADASGTVTFTDRNSGVLGTAFLVSGSAGFSTASLGAGPHTLTASYPGDPDHAASTSLPVTVTVLPQQTSLTLGGLPATLPYNTAARLTATLNPASATGSITLTDSTGAALGTALVSGGAAAWTLPALPAGPHTLSARYSGDTSFGGAEASLQVMITPDQTTTQLGVASGSVPAGTPVLLNVAVTTTTGSPPTGTVAIRIGQTTLTANLLHPLPGANYATISVDSAALGVGSFTGIASYAGDGDDLPSSSGPVSFQVVPIPVNLTLTVSPNPAAAGSPVVLQANLQAGTGVPSGTLSFFRDGTSLGSMPVAAGVAAMPLGGLPAGNYALTASFQPTGVYGPAGSATVVLVVTQPFRLSLDPDTVSLAPGSDASSTLRIEAQTGFSGAYTASCATPVAYLSCSVVDAAGPVSATTEVRVHSATTTAARRRAPGSAAFALLAAPLLLLGKRRRRVLMTGALLLLAGCAPGTFFNVPPGTFVVTVTVSAGGSVQSVPLTVHLVSP